ncbi:dihydrolipoyl dehydrogenase [Virgibacillus profundi]|nr:dihydrolipoyl dehydrogenase [Virgibacillus profundi]
MDKFDLAIIGGGPGGYVAAIRAAKEGLSVALVEGRDLGGTCLNRGCIPSKTLLKHAGIINQINDAKKYGITVPSYSISMSEMVDRKNKVINQLKNGIKGLLKQNKITVYQGYGYVANDKTVTIKTDNDIKKIKGDNIILANGSKPFVPELKGLNEINYYTSDTIFDIKKVPYHLVIVGGGVIGLEIACIFNSFGTKVEIVEMADRILPSEDAEASKFLAGQLTNNGITIHTETKITGFRQETFNTVVEVQHKGKDDKLYADAVLVSVGRSPNLTGIEDLSIKMNGKFVTADKNMQTSAAGIYAIGDLVGGYQLAHVASDEGIKAVNHMVGNPNVNSAIPRCVYTFPEIASVGLTEEQAKNQGYEVQTKKVDLAGNGKAIAAGENSGFMKLIADKKYGEVLGVVMVGSHVTEMVSQATSFMDLEGTVDEMDSMIFPHPTVSEALSEAASAWLGKGIHAN